MSGAQKYKVVFLGDEAAGKTSLVRRYMYDSFEEGIQATIGMDFQSKTLHLEDRTLRLQLWDTAGQERFRSLVPSYIRGAAAAVVVYDITRRKCFDGVRKWVDDVRNERGAGVLILLVGNKCDLVEEREVTEAEGKELAKEMGLHFAETSAKKGNNIKELFLSLAQNLPSDAGAAAAGPAAGGEAQKAAGGGGSAIHLRAGDAEQAKKKAKGCAC